MNLCRRRWLEDVDEKTRVRRNAREGAGASVGGLQCVPLALVLAGLLFPAGVAAAQIPQAVPPAQLVPLHSRLDVSTLPPPPRVAAPGPASVRVKPFRTPDPEGLRQWKSRLEWVRPSVAPDAAVIDDGRERVLAPLLAPIVSFQFEGLANADNVALTGFTVLPPDHGLGVAPDHVFQMVNIVGRISTKTGEPISSFSLNSFFAVEPGFDESDPRVIYDAASGRWFAVYLEFSATSSSIILMVSTTNDPTQVFCRYKIGNPTSETFLQDFPMLGISDDKVVVSYNGFSLSTDLFLGSGLYVLNKADLTGCTPTLRSLRVSPRPSVFNPPSSQALSPTGDVYLAVHGRTSLTVGRIRGVPGVSAVSLRTASFGIRQWDPPPSAPQAGSSVPLDTGDARVLSVVWQNNSLWLAGNEACVPDGDTATRSCLRVIQVATNTGQLLQDMSFGASGSYYMYPALSPDGPGNLIVVFQSSSPTTFLGVRATGRLTTDSPNTLQPSVELRAGGGAQTHPSGRTGDYSGAALDPSDSNAVWVGAEYVDTTGPANWRTIIAQMRF